MSPQQLVGIDSWQAWEAKGGSIFDLFFYLYRSGYCPSSSRLGPLLGGDAHAWTLDRILDAYDLIPDCVHWFDLAKGRGAPWGIMVGAPLQAGLGRSGIPLFHLPHHTYYGEWES